jgi:pimeloyl-ACP methyl ester carboxylesterase
MQVGNLILLPFLKTARFIHIASRDLLLTPEASDLYRQSVRAISLRTVLKVTQQAAAFQLPDQLRSSDIPVLVVAGEMEHRLIHQSMQLLLAFLPRAQGYLVPGGRHG